MTFLFGVFHIGFQIRGNRLQYEEKYYQQLFTFLF